MATKKKTKNYYVADFETTGEKQFLIEGRTRVYLWYYEGIYNDENDIGCNIKEFYDSITKPTYNTKIIFFHNLTFDINFFEYYLNEIGMKFVFDRNVIDEETGEKVKLENVYTVIRDEYKSVYQLCLYTNGIMIEFRDSLKLLQMSVDKLPNFRNIEKLKGYDYTRIRTEQKIEDFTPFDIEYVKHDVWKVKDVLKALLENIGDYLTIGSSSYAEYKQMINVSDKWAFKNLFPNLTEEEDTMIRKAYNGGIVILNELFRGIIINESVVSFDVNSLYPSRMKFEKLPYGSPIRIFTEDRMMNLTKKGYDLFIYCVEVKKMTIKGDYIPFIQLSKNYTFSAKKSALPKTIENRTFYWTSIDFENVLKFYDIDYTIQLDMSFAFKSKVGMFDEYIEKYYTMKENASKLLNSNTLTSEEVIDYTFKKMLSKFRLNTLYGKFATKTDRLSYSTEYNEENDELEFELYESKVSGDFYLPVGVFITAYARNVLITGMESERHGFIYADTDSLHILKSRFLNTIKIDDNLLGAWKNEGESIKTLFISNKQYLKTKKNKKGVYEITRTIASLNTESHHLVTFENMKKGSIIKDGKRVRMQVKGGYIIVSRTFTFT